MPSTINRRTALLGTVTLPAALAPLGLAGAATTPNATDAAWAELEAARAEHEALSAAAEAFETTLPEHLRCGNQPWACDFATSDDWEAALAAWQRERAAYPENPHDAEGSALDLAGDRVCDAENALLAVPAATLTDLERKVRIIAETRDDSEAEGPFAIGGILADVRRLMGRAA